MPFDCFVEDVKPPAIVPSEEQRRIGRLKSKHPDLCITVDFDEERKAVVIGKYMLHTFTHFKSLTSFMNAVMDAHDISGASYHPKWRAKTFAELFGITPRALYNHVNKLQYKKFVVPVQDILVKVRFKPGRISVGALECVRANEAVCREVYNDGLFHLLPVVAIISKSPQQLKAEWGKVWKDVSKNSLNKNQVLATNLKRLRYEGDVDAYDEKDLIGKLTALPTTVLKDYVKSPLYLQEHIAAHYRGRYSTLCKNAKDFHDVSYMVRDTKRLAVQLEAPFDPLWSPRKMKEKHDQYSRELTARKFSPAKIEWLKDVSVQELEHEGYKATLLDSRALIAEEGNAMGHCVAGYAESVAMGSYLVYSITKGGERTSTLGVHASEPSVTVVFNGKALPIRKQYRFSQHYGKFNRRLEDPTEIELGKNIVERLNKGEQSAS